MLLLVKLEVGVELEVNVKQQVGLRSAAQLLSNPAKLLQAIRFFWGCLGVGQLLMRSIEVKGLVWGK